MNNDHHPITPPPELVREWLDNDDFVFTTGTHDLVTITKDRLHSFDTQAARWGADRELESCCEWLRTNHGATFTDFVERDLRATRRPKPPSLKEQALSLLPDQPGGIAMKFTLHPDDIHTIRRALEALPE